LAGFHRQVRRELDTALLAACEPAAGVWDRWGAVRLLDTEIRPCLRAERDLVEAAIRGVPSPAVERLWALGELLEALGRRLCDLGRLAQGGAEFLRTAEKYRLAFDYWCREVDDSIGRLGRDTVPAALSRRLEEIECLLPVAV
jgi:hypothetical protein